MAATSVKRYTAYRGHRGWAVRRSGAKRAAAAGLSRFDAWREARRLARGAGGQAYLLDARTTAVVARNVYTKRSA